MPRPKITKGGEASDDQREYEKPSNFLHTEKAHKEWYTRHYQGKSKGRPWTGAEPKVRKAKKK